ncbi:MAG: glycoside hydrolase family 97 catalytic domain-containing protein [Clostridia bacterium]|nr:glycoside hydrolase family 97 catalytic domain-containing protein [Clostridia bacterium]
MWRLDSPEGRIRLEGTASQDTVRMSIWKDDVNCLALDFGLVLDTGTVSFENEMLRDIQSISESYSLPAGKMQTYSISACERLIDYGAVSLRIRADRQGVAFRYELATGASCICAEKTRIHFDEAYHTLYAQDLFSTYERPYEKRSWHDAHQQRLGMPVLVEAPHGWALVSEAELLSSATFCSCHLIGKEDRSLFIAFAPEENGQPVPLQMPFVSPWRYITLCDDLDELVQSHLAFDLCGHSRLADSSWIRPARALWAWWEYENGAQLYTESRRYVDTAAQMGFEAVVLDCGWDANWVPHLCRYAHQKGVQLWLWTDRHRVDTPEKMERWLPMWASWGIDGLKIDFFENDSLETMKAYRMLLKRTAELRMMVNFHGATKPAGDSRTWPHLMTTEGIMGLEHYKWSNMPDAVHNCTVPFTRNVCGPMDYTPVGFTNSNRNTTHAHQLALPVVFESGVTHYSLSVFLLEGWTGTNFLRRTKAKYDEVRVLAGHPGQDAAIMRRSGEEYFIGAITAEKQQMNLKLDFLPDGTFEAEIYEDDEKDQMLSVRREKVDAGTTLCLPLKPCGGAAIAIARSLPDFPQAAKQLQLVHAAECMPRGGSEPMRFVDGQTGMLLYGSMTFHLAARRTGWHTLRMFFTSVGRPRLCVKSGNRKEHHTLGEGKSWFDIRSFDLPVFLCDGDNEVSLERVGEAVATISKIVLLDQKPLRWNIYGKEDAVLTGDAEWTQNVRGVWEAVGLGMDAEIHFDHICAQRDGMHILSIRYCGGESRDISVQTNSDEPIHTYLHSTSGWGFPTWENAENKELLIHLHKGENHIRLFCKHGSMSHITSIAVCEDELGE